MQDASVTLKVRAIGDKAAGVVCFPRGEVMVWFCWEQGRLCGRVYVETYGTRKTI